MRKAARVVTTHHGREDGVACEEALELVKRVLEALQHGDLHAQGLEFLLSDRW